MKDFYGYKRYVNFILWEGLTCSIVSVRRDVIACDNVIYKIKLLCGSINEHGM